MGCAEPSAGKGLTSSRLVWWGRSAESLFLSIHGEERMLNSGSKFVIVIRNDPDEKVLEFTGGGSSRRRQVRPGLGSF
jgi:hypothetical protein